MNPALVSLSRKSLEKHAATYDAAMHPGGRPAKHPRSGFGARLVRVREDAGLSQLQLAEKMGITQQAVAHWERRGTAVRSDTLAKLASALGVAPADLLDAPTAKVRTSPAAPVGRARQIFEAVSRLPRRQQEKIFDIIQPFVREHAKAP
jgi:transcriptional regulator with XRE-family HTH domain